MTGTSADREDGPTAYAGRTCIGNSGRLTCSPKSHSLATRWRSCMGRTGWPTRRCGCSPRWTNLSETTFLLPPTDERADYRVRIFTPTRELPFAGHPTLGTAHAWLEAGGPPARRDVIVQECAAGLITLRRTAQGLAFKAPSTLRTGPVDEPTLHEIAAVLGVAPRGDHRRPVGRQRPRLGRRRAGQRRGGAGGQAGRDAPEIGVFGRHPAGSPEAYRGPRLLPVRLGHRPRTR